jgi:hypothetical protein
MFGGGCLALAATTTTTYRQDMSWSAKVDDDDRPLGDTVPKRNFFAPPPPTAALVTAQPPPPSLSPVVMMMADYDCDTTMNNNNKESAPQPPPPTAAAAAQTLVRPPSLPLLYTPAGTAVGVTTTNKNDMIHEDDEDDEDDDVDVDVDDDRCRRRTKKNRLSSVPPPSLRRGKWSQEEEAYSARLIHEFVAGVLPLTHEGTTLRAFLSQTLHCDPMRITKKLADCDSIGKHKFQLRRQHGDHSYSTEQLQQKQAELWELERLYLVRVNAISPTTTVGGVERLEEPQQHKHKHKPPPKKQLHRHPHHTPTAGKKIYKISHPTHSSEGQRPQHQQQQQQELLRPLISQAPHEQYPSFYSFPPQWTTQQQLPHHYYSRQQQLQPPPPPQTYAVPRQQPQQQRQLQQSPSIHFQHYPYWQQHQPGALAHEAIATAAESSTLINPCDRFLPSTSTRPFYSPGGTWHRTMMSTPAPTAVLENPSPTTATGVAPLLATAADGHRNCFVHQQQQQHRGDSCCGMSIDDGMTPNTPSATVAPCNCKHNCESLMTTTTIMNMNTNMMRNNNTDSTNTNDGSMIMSLPLRQVLHDRDDSLTSMNSADFIDTLLCNDDDDVDDGGDDNIPGGEVQRHEFVSSNNNDNDSSSSSSHSRNDTSFELAPMDDDDDDDEIDSLDLSSIGE